MKNEMLFKEQGDCLVVLFNGVIDHETTLLYRSKLVKTIDEGKYKKVVLNFAGVTFIDSSGIGMVLGRYNQIRHYGGLLYLTKLPQDTRRLFDLTGLFTIIEVIDDVSEVAIHA